MDHNEEYFNEYENMEFLPEDDGLEEEKEETKDE